MGRLKTTTALLFCLLVLTTACGEERREQEFPRGFEEFHERDWSRFPVGASAIYLAEYTSADSRGEMSKVIRADFTHTIIRDGKGQRVIQVERGGESGNRTRNEPIRQMFLDRLAAEETTRRGRDMVVHVGGQNLTCETYRMTDTIGELVKVVTIWYSAKVPGGVVRQEETSTVNGQLRWKSKIELIDFEVPVGTK